MSERKKILITGSSGRIGTAVAACLDEHYDLLGLDQRPGRWTTRIGNITESSCLGQMLPGVDAVIHTAALHAPHVGKVPDQRFNEINVSGTECVLEGCLRHSVRRLVYTSTTSVYGNAMVDQDRAVWVDEALPPQPRDIYDQTKIAAENLCRQAAGQGLSCIALRMSRCFPEALRLMAIYRLYRGVDARDVAMAHELAIHAQIESFDVFNISAQSPFAQSDLVELMQCPGEVIRRCYPWAQEAFDSRGWSWPRRIDRVYRIGRAVAILGYQPRYNFNSLFGT